MNSAETIEIFYNIRTSLEKLEYASHITKIINDVTYENQNTYRILQLYLNTLYIISEIEKDLDFVASIFKLRLLSMIGFKPEVGMCQSCKTKENLNYFSFKNSGLKCDSCSKQDKSAIQINPTTKDAIRYIILTDPKKLFSFDVPEESKKELKIISKIYITDKLEREYKM